MQRTALNTLGTMLGLLAVVLICSSFTHHAASEHKGIECPDPKSNLNPGDYLYAHDCYHQIYKTINKGGDNWWESCCKGDECRVTDDIQDAPTELKMRGVDYLVVVDGRMCHASARHHVKLSPEQLAQVKTNPLYQSFMRHSHVCASLPKRGEQRISRPAGTSPKYDPEEAKKCPVIHCIIVGPRA